MPTTTNPTPAEISRLERVIAEKVMGWGETDYDWMSWSPWYEVADALDVLEKVCEMHDSKIWRIDKTGGRYDVQVRSSLLIEVLHGHAPGPHFGPAVCRLAEKIGNSILDSPNPNTPRT